MRWKLLIIPLLCIYSIQAIAGTNSNHHKNSRNFWHPMYHGIRLDYCTFDGVYCGKKVATGYCRLFGYDYSDHYVKAYNVGQTNFISTRLRCTGWRCNGFMTINCVKDTSKFVPKAYHFTQRKFVKPRFNNYRVDWCYDQHHGCGFLVADSFCKREGYSRAIHYTKERYIGATKAIGNQELCFGRACIGFGEITCYR